MSNSLLWHVFKMAHIILSISISFLNVFIIMFSNCLINVRNFKQVTLAKMLQSANVLKKPRGNWQVVPVTLSGISAAKVYPLLYRETHITLNILVIFLIFTQDNFKFESIFSVIRCWTMNHARCKMMLFVTKVNNSSQSTVSKSR